MCIFSLLYTVLKISSISYPYQCLFWHGTGKNFLKVSGMLVIMFVFHCLTFIGVEIEIKIQIWHNYIVIFLVQYLKTSFSAS